MMEGSRIHRKIQKKHGHLLPGGSTAEN
jgi:hypothetical protein